MSKRYRQFQIREWNLVLWEGLSADSYRATTCLRNPKLPGFIYLDYLKSGEYLWVNKGYPIPADVVCKAYWMIERYKETEDASG